MDNSKSIYGDSWTEKAARIILPILVWYAKKGEPITYSYLDTLIVKHGLLHHVMAVQYGKPAGLIGDVLIGLEKEFETIIPPINALIVSKTNDIPSEGVDWYLERYIRTSNSKRTFSLEDKKAIVDEIHNDIYSFDYWDNILDFLKLDSFKPKKEFKIQRKKVKEIYRGGWSSEGESDEHKDLKDFIAANPHVIGLKYDSGDSETEYTFPSSDKADIVFKKNDNWTAVEIKSRISNERDISRGIYQCIKYKALLRSEQKALGLPPVARSYLVVENELTDELIDLADILGVKILKYRLKMH